MTICMPEEFILGRAGQPARRKNSGERRLRSPLQCLSHCRSPKGALAYYWE